MSAPAGAWPRVRAALVGLHVLGVVLMATPSPAVGLRRSLWKEPTVQAEFKAWNERFRAVGFELGQEEMEDLLWDFATSWEKGRSILVAPFVPYGRYLGPSQSWRMFVAPHRYPTRLHVEIEEGGDWRTVYVERSREHTWLGRAFDHDRMRSAIFRFGWPQYRRSWEQFAAWVADRAATDFPEATRVRVSMYKYRTLSPEEARAGQEPDGKFQQERVLDLASLREGAP